MYWNFSVCYTFFVSKIKSENQILMEFICIIGKIFFYLPMSLNFCIFKRLRLTTTPYTQKIISYHRMEVHCHVHIFKVSFFSRISKLPVKQIEIFIPLFKSFVSYRVGIFFIPILKTYEKNSTHFTIHVTYTHIHTPTHTRLATRENNFIFIIFCTKISIHSGIDNPSYWFFTFNNMLWNHNVLYIH